MRFSLRSVAWLVLAVSCGCTRGWDPDAQMARERQIMENARVRGATLAKSQAEENVRKIKRDAIIKVRPSLTEQELAEVAGHRYESLARTERDGSVWEHRRYLLGDAVSSLMGSYSREYEICEKDHVLFEVLVGEGIVRDVDY